MKAEETILERINRMSAMLNDLSVYLNRCPQDERAREWFRHCSGEREALLRQTEAPCGRESRRE